MRAEHRPDRRGWRHSALTYDYDKDPKGFFIWLESMGGFVRSTEGGPDLEDMLDSKLHRKPDAGRMIPSFLQDPDFDPVPDRPLTVPSSEVGSEEDAASATVGEETAPVQGTVARSTVLGSQVTQSAGSGLSGQFSLGQHHTSFADLPDVSKKLDAVLYNILRMNSKGSIASLLQYVR